MFAEPWSPIDSPASANVAVANALTPIYDDSVSSIESAYSRLGHTLGWRFLTGPKATLSSKTQIGFITLNPGGDSEPADHPRASCEAGNSYLIESWFGCAPGAAPLQRQVQALFRGLANHFGTIGSLSDFMTEQVLMGYFIPFRSPRFATLPRRQESLAFGRQLWTAILAQWSPRLLLTIDTEAFAALRVTLRRHPGSSQDGYKRFDTGWGKYQAEAVRISIPGSLAPITLARLPHLSTFKLFSREECHPHIENFLAYVTQKP